MPTRQSLPAGSVGRPRGALAAAMLAWREVIRFFRQRGRVVGAVGQPLLFWLLFGAGLHGTFRLEGPVRMEGPGAAAGVSAAPTSAAAKSAAASSRDAAAASSRVAAAEGASFLRYYFPGTLTLVLLFAAILSTMSLIEDRREGFLQAVLASPAPRWSVLLGKVGGGAALAWLQAALLLPLALSLGCEFDFARWAGVAAVLALTAWALASLGLALAWRMESTQGFHAIMNLALMPMWMLSGAFFPAPAAAAGDWGQAALHWAMRLNPLSYPVAAARALLDGPLPAERFWSPSLGLCWLVTALFAAGAFALAAWVCSRSGGGHAAG